mmetsp:Transcript_130517/g.309653  ORF Transcript_130517/g.309653 Transcript_130517/m.309653 type:complete len:94 (-) Transcript_130517:1088-1369(-)
MDLWLGCRAPFHIHFSRQIAEFKGKCAHLFFAAMNRLLCHQFDMSGGRLPHASEQNNAEKQTTYKCEIDAQHQSPCIAFHIDESSCPNGPVNR